VTPAAAIDAVDVVKRYDGTVALDRAGLLVPKGQLVAVLGPSGSGKTTMLRMIAGFERPDAGTVRIDGRLVAGDGVWVEPERRRVGMVFQDGALFPHLSVERNVGFGTKQAARIAECLELVGLAGRGRSFPHELSGGERQRVALARALAGDPDVILLDEPFASLDTALRTSLREEVATILHDAGATALMVTHDQQEALSLADTVVLMRDGRVEQVGTPRDVYARPASRWAAEFLGALDVLTGTAGGDAVTCVLGRFPVDGLACGGKVDVVIRPESVVVGAPDEPAPAGTVASTPATIVARTFFGPDQLVTLALSDGSTIRSRCPGFADRPIGAQVTIWIVGPVNAFAAEPE
jgi:iron(III) transport system ATP-binding protein